MPHTSDRRGLQSIYPEVQPRSGMAAKKPVKFTIPILTVSLLLALPLYAVTALTIIDRYSNITSRTGIAGERVTLITAFMILGVIGIAMLIYARRIIVRNCSQSWVIQLLYAAVVVPLGVFSLNEIGARYGSTNFELTLVYQAVVVYAMSLLLTFIAWLQSR